MPLANGFRGPLTAFNRTTQGIADCAAQQTAIDFFEEQGLFDVFH
jgi:hypothetical protein